MRIRPNGSRAGARSRRWPGRPSFVTVTATLFSAFCTLFVLGIGPWPITSQLVVPPQNFDSLAGREKTSHLPLRAGIGVANLAVPEGLPLAGIFNRVLSSSAGTADPLSVGVLALSTDSARAYLVTGDLLLINKSLQAKIIARFREHDPTLQEDQVYFGATHNHSGPGGWAQSPFECLTAGMPDPEYVEQIVQAFAVAFANAQDTMEPAEIGQHATWLKPGAVTNRLTKGGAANRWLDVLSVRKADNQKALATVVFVAAHALTRRLDDSMASAEYPGTLRRLVQEKTGAPCLVFAAAVGQMVAGDFGQRRGPLRMESAGADYAAATLQLLPEIRHQSQTSLLTKKLMIPLPEQQVRLGPTGLRLSPFLTGLVLPTHAEVHVLVIGDLHLIGTPFDYSGELAMELRHLTPGSTTLITSFSGDYAGYVVPDSSYDHVHYETMLMSYYGPRLGSYFNGALARVSQSLP